MTTQNMLIMTRTQADALRGPCVGNGSTPYSTALEPIDISAGNWALPTEVAGLTMSDAKRTIIAGLSTASVDSGAFISPRWSWKRALADYALSLNQISSFTSATALDEIQGVSADTNSDTVLWTSEVGVADPGELRKWGLSGGIWSSLASKALNTVADHVTHISSVTEKDGLLYVPDIQDVNNPANCSPRVVAFNAADFSYNSVVLNETTRTGYTSEAVQYFNGAWWFIGDSVPAIIKYDDSWNFVKEYAIPVGDTSTEFDGYQGLVFWTSGGNTYCGVTVHNDRPQQALVILQYVGDAFVEVGRRLDWPFANQGICRARGTTDASSLWIADRTDPAQGVVRNFNATNWRTP